MKEFAKRYVDKFSFVGLVTAALFFAASVTPSLLPRNMITQGLLSGFALAVGYGLGVALVWTHSFFELPSGSAGFQRNAKWLAAVSVIVLFIVCLWKMTDWQNSIRVLMEMPPLRSADPITTALIAITFGALLVAMGRIVVVCLSVVFVWLNRFLPRRVAATFSGLVVGFTLLMLVNGVVARGLLIIADRISLHADELIEEGTDMPQDALACGSMESSIAWASIGRMGKQFLTGGPSRGDIELLWKEAPESEIKTPLRVYVGMRSAPSQRERAQLALKELIRTGAFDRSVMIVATPTGTGWLDPGAVDTVEYLHRGDTVIVSMQYSYLPSWISILVDPTRSIRSARYLFDEIYDHWTTLPPAERPKLYLQGLSLGALGAELSADIYTMLDDPIDGAVFSGAPFPSSRWSAIVEARNSGSSVWLPKIDRGRVVRFTAQENSLEPERPWGKMRNVYIQYASDPMVFFRTDLWKTQPPWLQPAAEGQPTRGPDVSPQLRWVPIVTGLQIAFDLPMATSVPVGYGHNYSPKSYLAAWIAVTDPKGWTEEQSRQLLDSMQ